MRADAATDTEDLRALLDGLGRRIDVGAVDAEVAAREVGRHVSGALRCSRVSLWAMDGETGERVLRRCGGWDAMAGRGLRANHSLLERECPVWFHALTRDAMIVCADTREDAMLDAMIDRRLRPRDALALLDIAIGVNGRPTGLMRCEQHGQPRVWSMQDVGHARRIAAEISLRRARRRRSVSLLQGWG